MKYKRLFFIFCVGTATAKVFLVETHDTETAENNHRLVRYTRIVCDITILRGGGDYAFDQERGELHQSA